MTVTTVPFTTSARWLIDAGFVGWQVVTMNAIGCAESRLDPLAVHRVNKPGSLGDGSLDHGWLQLNDYWQRRVLMSELLLELPVSTQLANGATCARVARQVFLGPGNVIQGYNLWNTYITGAHLPFLPEARAAARSLGVAV
jgi:hypothetical protein